MNVFACGVCGSSSTWIALPCSTSLPSCKNSTSSAIRCVCCNECVIRITQHPVCFWYSRSSVSASNVDSTSIAADGSSKISKSYYCINSLASTIRAVSPPESFLAGARASSVSFRAASNSSARFIPSVLGLSTPRLSIRFCRTLI